MLGRRMAQIGVADVQLYFNRFDADRNDTLDASELLRMLEAIGFEVEPPQVLAFVKYCDKDGDNKISLGEFKDALDYFHNLYKVPKSTGRSQGLALQKTISLQIQEATGKFLEILPADAESERAISEASKKLEAEKQMREDKANKHRKEMEERIKDLECPRDFRCPTWLECVASDDGLSAWRPMTATTWLGCVASDDGDGGKPDPNPAISTHRVKWDFATGKQPCWFRSFGACVDFLPDADAKGSNNMFMRPDAGARIQLRLPDAFYTPTPSTSRIKVIEDSSFDAMARNAGHWVFLGVYRAECARCEQLAPVWEELAMKFGADSGQQAAVTLAKLDATSDNLRASLNRMFNIHIRSFPTLLLFKGDGTAPQEYKGDIDLNALTSFVTTHTGSGASKTGYAVYSFSMCFRLPELPVEGMPLFSFNHDRIVVKVFQSGEVKLQSEALAGDAADDDDDDAFDMKEVLCPYNPVHNPLIMEEEWSVITAVFDTTAKTLKLYVDGSMGAEYTDVDGLAPLTSASTWCLLSTEMTRKGTASVAGDIRFACLDLTELSIEGCENSACSILELHVPVGVWRCVSCFQRNGVGYDRCQACSAEKKRSATRPAGDCDPEHPGLTIVVSESFNEIVLDAEKHVFLDVSADWCGPSIQMKPQWHALANLLKERDDILIAYMDADANETDPFYLSETHVPNLKLFPKGNKDDFVCFPNGEQRDVSGFIKFLERHANLDIRKFAEDRWPEFYAKNGIQALEARAQGAVAVAIRDTEKSLERAAKGGNRLDEMTLFHGFASRGKDCGRDAPSFEFLLRRFLAHYFQCPTVFESDADLCRQMQNCTHQSKFFAADKIQGWIALVIHIVKDSLMRALPEKPAEHLAMDLQVCLHLSACTYHAYRAYKAYTRCKAR